MPHAQVIRPLVLSVNPCVAVDPGSCHTAIGKLNCWLSPRSHSKRLHVVHPHAASGREGFAIPYLIVVKVLEDLSIRIFFLYE